MHFFSGFSHLVVIIDKLRRLPVASSGAYVAIKIVVDGWQPHVATCGLGRASCQ